MKKISTILMFLLLAGTLYAERKTVTLDLPTMNCEVCPVTVKKALIRENGVLQADVNLEKKSAVVTYDTAKTDTEKLIEATTNAGYPSIVKK